MDFLANIHVEYISTPVQPPSEMFKFVDLIQLSTSTEEMVEEIPDDLFALDQAVNNPIVEVRIIYCNIVIYMHANKSANKRGF